MSLNASYIQKFMFDKLPIKGSLVVLNDAWEIIANQKQYPDGLRQLMGELLTANVLMVSNLKLDGKIICQIQDNPYFNLVVTECNHALKVRATAKFAIEDNNIEYANYLKHGRLAVSVNSDNDGELYQSVIAFNGNSVSDVLNNYMLQSEQLRSWFIIAYSAKQVVGLMLQQLPDTHSQFQNEIERVFMLANTLSKTELLHDDLERIIYKLFNEDDVVVFEPHQINFACRCSRTRVAEILRNLGKDELLDIIAKEGEISVDCEYCNTVYQFTQLELEQFVLQLSLDEMQAVSSEIN